MIALVPLMADNDHVDAAKLDDDVWACCQFGKISAPIGHHLLAHILIVADAERFAAMIGDNRQFRKSAGNLGQLVELWVPEVRLENQVSAGKDIIANMRPTCPKVKLVLTFMVMRI